MVKLPNNLYKIKSYSKEDLKSLGFYYNKEKNTDENTYAYYSYRFPVLKYNDRITMDAEITIDADTGDIEFDVFDLKGNHYLPFYNCEYGNFNDILAIINKNIMKKLKELGFIKLKLGGHKKCRKW